MVGIGYVEIVRGGKEEFQLRGKLCTGCGS